MFRHSYILIHLFILKIAILAQMSLSYEVQFKKVRVQTLFYQAQFSMVR